MLSNSSTHPIIMKPILASAEQVAPLAEAIHKHIVALGDDAKCIDWLTCMAPANLLVKEAKKIIDSPPIADECA